MRLATIEPEGRVRGTVVLLHGFGRGPERLADLGERLSARGARVVLPALSAWWWPTCTNNTRFLTHVADVIGRLPVVGPIAVVGHSAGAAAGAWVAARLVSTGHPVSGVVLVDGVDSPVRAIRRSWATLRRVPTLAICGDPSPCNRHGALERWLRAQPHEADRPWEIISVPGMGHGDVEGAGIGVYVRLCRDDPGAPRRTELLGLIEGAVDRALQAPAK